MAQGRKKSSDSRIASLRLQNAEYNESYRNWRIEHRSDVGFYVSGNQEELTWRDGEGFVGDSPVAMERGALEQTASVIGKTLVLYALLGIISRWIFAEMKIGSDTVGMVRGGYFEGNETTALIMTYIVNILWRVLPQFYLLRKVKMPMKVYLPMKVENKPMFRAAVPVAMFVFAVISMMSGLGEYFFAAAGFDVKNTVWIPEGRVHMVLSAILYIVIMPFISEVVHRGTFLQTLRQFGDGCALIFTSVIAGLTAPGSYSWVYTFAYSFIVGFFAMRTGSILTAFIMRAVLSGSSFLLTYIRQTGMAGSRYMDTVLLILTAYLIIGGIGLIIFIKKHSNKISLPFYGMYVSNRDKIMCMASCPWIIIWLALTVITAMVSSVI